MLVVGVTETGVIVEMSDDEIMRACGYEYRAEFEQYLDKANARAERSLWRASAPKAGTVIPLADWHRTLCSLRRKANELSKVGESMRGFADIVAAAATMAMGRIDGEGGGA